MLNRVNSSVKRAACPIWLASILSMALPHATFATTVDIPAVTTGDFTSRRAGTTVLTQAKVASVVAWLERHRSGWQTNLATPPIAEVTIDLDTTAQRAAIVLSLWPKAQEPGWRQSVLVEVPATGSAHIQTFPTGEIAQLQALIGP